VKKMPDELQTITAARARRVLEDALAVAANYAFIAFMVLSGIWLIGRIIEATHGNTVFDPVMTHRLGVSIGILLVIWIIGSGMGSAKDLSKAERKWRSMLPWVFFLILLGAVLYDLKGFQVSSSGLFATLSGSAESSKQAYFLLFKFHPANPMLAANLIASKLRGTVDFESLAYYVNRHTLFAFFIWSLAYGILLLMHKNDIWQKTMHLTFAG